MIKSSPHFNLGLDATRIKDKRDADRQHATVQAILSRMFNPTAKNRWELQILADEVGLGKTFVGLGVAYSILAHMRAGNGEPDLDGCYQKVLVITPRNGALYAKWFREVSEFVKRCIVEERREEAASWFAPVDIDRLDDLAVELRKRGPGPRVLVTHMGIFGGGKLTNYNLKRRFLLGALFRFWGTRFRFDARERLLRGAPPEWPRDPSSLTSLTADEQELLSFTEEELLSALDRQSRRDDQVEKLLEECISVSEPYTHGRDELFRDINDRLNALYRSLATALIGRDLPLVIVDEAHNWKNGPTSGANGYYAFQEAIACRTRRALLLTATPFQLRPDEMLELLKVSDDMAPCPTKEASEPRRERLRRHREETVRPVLKNSAEASRRFSRAWSRMPPTVRTEEIEEVWRSTTLDKARTALRDLAAEEGVASEQVVARIVQRATLDVDPVLREFVREALFVYTHNADLSAEMSPLVIRHRRKTQHRAFRVGSEYGAEQTSNGRTDTHVLHAAPGLDVKGEGELPHYLLMRCVSEMKQGKGRSSLGSALTGCYSTLLHSAEGKQVQNRLRDSPLGAIYLDLLGDLVKEKQDPKHPKLREVVDSVVRAWHAGEKTLIFCFRINTAHRLRDIIDDKIRKEMNDRRRRCLGGEEALKALRGRLTGKDRDLVGLGLDRVLWSYWWASSDAPPFGREHLEITERDLAALARLSLRHGVDLGGDRIDRVFLNRALEHVLAKRLYGEVRPKRTWARLLPQIADGGWVEHPYGLGTDAEADEGGEERADFDERGTNTRYPVREERPSRRDIDETTTRLVERWQRGQFIVDGSGILDSYARGPSLWLGANPLSEAPPNVAATVRSIHQHLAELCRAEDGTDWEVRRLLFQSLRRALLRESVLLRLLPDKTDLEERRWGDLLAERFFAPMQGQRESMADRVAVFLEDLRAASGSITEEGSARYALFDATRLKDQQFVALVAGGKDERARERAFAGFNSPLLPEVLVCTSVGQEGIDLHRHCRHVVHYDLAWNPAVLEQRTGRADRIGSKTFRERAHDDANGAGPFLEIGVPFLAGTYDERMYEELRVRAQTFEVLTGGDVAADGDNREGRDDVTSAEGSSQRVALVPLPERILRELRVNLHVWEDVDPVAARPTTAAE